MAGRAASTCLIAAGLILLFLFPVLGLAATLSGIVLLVRAVRTPRSAGNP